MQRHPRASDQLRLVIDVLHVFGIAVLIDVVYNHAGGEFGDESLYFFDRASSGNNNNSLYFTDQGWAGGLVFANWNSSVRQFLIDNAIFCFSEYHIDGLRYDEVSVIEHFGGWSFYQDLTRTVRFRNPAGAQIAEFWNADQGAAVRPTKSGGGGFDLVWHAGLRDAIRAIIGQAAGGRDALVDLDLVRDALNSPEGFGAAWRAVQMLENHDILLAAHSGEDRRPRISALSDYQTLDPGMRAAGPALRPGSSLSVRVFPYYSWARSFLKISFGVMFQVRTTSYGGMDLRQIKP